MIKLVNQFDSYKDRAGMATPSGECCCCSCCCCCLITATTARLLEVRYFAGIEKQLRETPPSEQKNLKIHEVMNRPNPWLFSAIFHGLLIILGIGGLGIMGLASTSSTSNPMIAFLFISLIVYSVIQLHSSVKMHNLLNRRTSEYGMKCMSFGQKLGWIAGLLICTSIEIFIIGWIVLFGIM